MGKICWTALVSLSITGATVTSVMADGRRGTHAPIFVRTPSGKSPITPYYFDYYRSHYSYNLPGPVFSRLRYWGPRNGCRLWRYNYLIWVC